MTAPTEFHRSVAEGRVAYHGETDTWYDTTSWRPFDLLPILRGELTVAPPEYLARADGARLIYPGRSHSFFGPSETLKSWVALLACKSVLEAGRTALYLDFESEPVSFVERARIVGIADAELGTRLKYARPEEPLAKETGTAWDLATAERELRPALVVIDGVSEAYTLHGLDVLSTTDAVKYQHLLLRGFSEGVATLEIDHTSKTEGRGQFGAQQKRAGIDGAQYEFVGAHVEGEGGHSSVRLKVTKDRHGRVRASAPDGAIGTFHLDTTPDREGPAAWIEAPDPRNAAERAEESVWGFLEENPASSKRAVRSGVEGFGDHTIDEALRALEEDGMIASEPGPRNAKLYSVNGIPLGGP